MKLSVSIPDEDIAFVDHYADEHRLASRSRVVQRALSLLRASELGDDYAAAWLEWDTGEAELWDVTAGDGVGAAST
ncbi:MAG: ribbon-helix-helix domain-containing protein [Actinomycetota bacterium]|nr:ribbon-helix-helix domain-containing protein [Actinomycetota bacterium]